MKLLDLIRVSVPKVGQQIEALHVSLANIELVSCNMQSTCSSNSSNGWERDSRPSVVFDLKQREGIGRLGNVKANKKQHLHQITQTMVARANERNVQPLALVFGSKLWKSPGFRPRDSEAGDDEPEPEISRADRCCLGVQRDLQASNEILVGIRRTHSLISPFIIARLSIPLPGSSMHSG